MDDRHYMQMALDLAAKGRGDTSPNPMVGAVLVRQGRVVGRGYHEAVGGPHAEVNAIADAGDLAAAGGCVIVPESEIISLADTLIPLLANPERLAAMGSHARAVGKPDAAIRVARAILEVPGAPSS